MQIPMDVLAPLASLFVLFRKPLLNLRFRKALGRRMQKTPKSFYDKVFWMSLNADTSLWTKLADKIMVRDYVKGRCGEKLLPQLYKTYELVDDIDFEELPNSFVIKTNNGCSSNYIVRSKEAECLEYIREGLRKWLRVPYGELTGQMHYAGIKPMVLAEELMYNENDPEGVLVDYKFFCFDGDVRYCYVAMDRAFGQVHSYRRMMYNMDWEALPGVFVQGFDTGFCERPSTFEEMRKVASLLSEGIPFVRVDLYEVNGQVKFGEMTFTPGLGCGFTDEFQRTMGDLIELPKGLTC